MLNFEIKFPLNTNVYSDNIMGIINTNIYSRGVERHNGGL